MAPLALIVPLEDPDMKATLRFKLELVAEDTWPVTVNVVPVGAIAGKHDEEGLLTAVTVPVMLFPLWLKLTVNVVLGGAVPCEPVAAKATFQFPVIAGV